MAGHRLARRHLLGLFKGARWLEWVRTARLRLLQFYPPFRAAVSSSAAILATNHETIRYLKSAGAGTVPLFWDSGVVDESLPDRPAVRAQASTVRILWASRFQKRKALPLALEAMTLDQGAVPLKLAIAGGGEEDRQWRALAASLGLGDRVEFLGELSPAAMQAEFDKADIFLFTSVRDSCASVVLEAMIHALPVVTLNIHGVGAYMPDTAGIKVAAESRSATVRALRRRSTCLPPMPCCDNAWGARAGVTPRRNCGADAPQRWANCIAGSRPNESRRPSPAVGPRMRSSEIGRTMRAPVQQRVPSLDSLRGLAALSVVLCHVFWLYRPNSLRVLAPPHSLNVESVRSWIGQLPGTFLIDASPLHVLMGGHEAVILFYLISGFVLYLACERSTDHPYRDFLIRRLCRLYLPYLAGLGVALAFIAAFSTGHLSGMNDWINHTWLLPIERREALKHVLLVGNLNTDLFLMPCWTLVHEMRIAFVFPLLAGVIASRGRWWPGVAIALSVSGIALDALLGQYGNYFISLHYAALFLVGAWLARERLFCLTLYRGMSPGLRTVMLLTALAFYGYGRFVAVLPSVPVSVADIPIAAGGAFLIVWSMTNPRVLAYAPVRWLGRVCYGLYLLHLSFFLAAMYIVHGRLPLWVTLMMAVPASFVAAELFHRLIEAPAIRLGRRLTTMPVYGVDIRGSVDLRPFLAGTKDQHSPALQRSLPR